MGTNVVLANLTVLLALLFIGAILYPLARALRRRRRRREIELDNLARIAAARRRILERAIADRTFTPDPHLYRPARFAARRAPAPASASAPAPAESAPPPAPESPQESA